jgi:hypothetical protein
VANTGYDLWEVDTDLPCSLVLNTDQAIGEYVYSHKESDDEMFLCGIKGFRDLQGSLISELLGKTCMRAQDTVTFEPSSYSGSLVAVKACMIFAAPEYKLDYNALVTSTTVHELTHQRAVWGHHIWGSGPRFFRMNPTPWYPSGHNSHPHWAEVYSNPHFCEICINKIKNITW